MAEAGKTYFYRTVLVDETKDYPAKVELKPIESSEGMLLISQPALSVYKPK